MNMYSKFHLKELTSPILTKRLKVACTKNLATLCMFKNCITVIFCNQFDVSLCDLFKSCSCPPLAEPEGCLSFLQPADTLHYQCDPAHWHFAMSKTVANLTLRKPNNAKT